MKPHVWWCSRLFKKCARGGREHQKEKKNAFSFLWKRKKRCKLGTKSNLKSEWGRRGRGCFRVRRVLSLFTLDINGWKVKGNKWGEGCDSGRRGRRASGRPRRAERHVYPWPFSRTKKPISLGAAIWLPAGRCDGGNTLDLICFALLVFGDAAIMRDRGLTIKRGRCLYFSLLFFLHACLLSRLLRSPPTCSAARPPASPSSLGPRSIVPRR